MAKCRVVQTKSVRYPNYHNLTELRYASTTGGKLGRITWRKTSATERPRRLNRSRRSAKSSHLIGLTSRNAIKSTGVDFPRQSLSKTPDDLNCEIGRHRNLVSQLQEIRRLGFRIGLQCSLLSWSRWIWKNFSYVYLLLRYC